MNNTDERPAPAPAPHHHDQQERAEVQVVDDSGHPIPSYAGPAARDRFITAMTRLYARRAEHPGQVRVYFSAPPVLRRQQWQARVDRVRAALPAGVVVCDFDTVFPPGTEPEEFGPDQHRHWWTEYAAGVDGLIVHGGRNSGRGRIFRLGPAARVELRTMVELGRPVLLHAAEYGLVPLIDCAARRFGPPDAPRLALRVPPAWDPAAPTLAAALGALTPVASARGR